MSDEELRIKVAELCGYQFDHRYKGSKNWAEIVVIIKDGMNAGSFFPGDRGSMHGAKMLRNAGVPDYPNDLNAMHEALNTLLSDGSWKRFVDSLEQITGACRQPEPTRSMLLIGATARQRAEAFVTTMAGAQLRVLKSKP